MATLFIAVWEDAKEVALGDPIQEIVVTISGTSAQSAVIAGVAPRRKRVRLFCDVDCFVTWNVNPTATADGLGGRPMGIENPEFWDMLSGNKIAVIAR